jgi:uncharacterized protein (TIGR02147 family)
MNLETSYRDILKIELADRLSNNPAYSLRALARHMGVSPSLLSDVLKGKKGISSGRAFEVGQALRFDGMKLDYFVTLVQIEETKSPQRKAELLEKLNSLDPKRRVQDISLDVFKVIYDWYHLAILELTTTTGFKLTASTAAKKLNITELEADTAIQRLLRLELLKPDATGKLTKADTHILTTSKVPNTALRNYHAQMLKKATDALTNQTPQEKLIGSETFAFDQKHLKEANVIIEECFTKLVNLALTKKAKKHVYHFGIQLFRLTQKEE